MKYQIGSKILGLNNARDNDYLAVVEDTNYYNRIVTSEYELKEISQDLLLKNLNFETRFAIYNYQYDKQIIGNEFPIEYHLMEHRKQLIEFISNVINNKEMNFNKRITVNNGCCSKLIYHVAWNIFALINNNVILTEEQKEIVQKIHDEEMPIKYLDTLTSLFRNFLINSNS